MYDEDQDELNQQYHRIGEYRRTNPDLAVGSTAQLPESAPAPEHNHPPHFASLCCPACEAESEARLREALRIRLEKHGKDDPMANFLRVALLQGKKP